MLSPNILVEALQLNKLSLLQSISQKSISAKIPEACEMYEFDTSVMYTPIIYAMLSYTHNNSGSNSSTSKPAATDLNHKPLIHIYFPINYFETKIRLSVDEMAYVPKFEVDIPD